MVENYGVVAAIAVVCAVAIVWGGRILPGERWQFFASLPLRRREDGLWEAANITWYGMILAGATVFAIALFLVMMAAMGSSRVAGLVLMALLLLVCVPAASLVARLVERKPATLTIGGAAFVGGLVAPALILAQNRVAGALLGGELPMAQTLAACAVAFLFGEGMGRLACLSYGCCYGKPVAEYRGLLRWLFERTAIVFHGSTKKISYAAGLEGQRIVPVQLVTMLVLSGAGLVSLLLYGAGRPVAAYLLATSSAGGWRIFSELFRNDYRGGGRLSAYQLMAGVSVLYGAGVAWLLSGAASSAQPVRLLAGVASLWSPGILVSLGVVWIALLLYTGISSTTFSRISFHLHRDKL